MHSLLLLLWKLLVSTALAYHFPKGFASYRTEGAKASSFYHSLQHCLGETPVSCGHSRKHCYITFVLHALKTVTLFRSLTSLTSPCPNYYSCIFISVIWSTYWLFSLMSFCVALASLPILLSTNVLSFHTNFLLKNSSPVSFVGLDLLWILIASCRLYLWESAGLWSVAFSWIH